MHAVIIVVEQHTHFSVSSENLAWFLLKISSYLLTYASQYLFYKNLQILEFVRERSLIFKIAHLKLFNMS